jgi:hypothetical protein
MSRKKMQNQRQSYISYVSIHETTLRDAKTPLREIKVAFREIKRAFYFSQNALLENCFYVFALYFIDIYV